MAHTAAHLNAEPFDGDGVALGVVSTFLHIPGSWSSPLPHRRQIGVNQALKKEKKNIVRKTKPEGELKGIQNSVSLFLPVCLPAGQIGLHRNADSKFLRMIIVGRSFSVISSPRAHPHVVGMLRFMSGVNQPSLPTPLYSVLVSISIFIALSAVFHSINSPDNSPFSDSVLPVLSLPYWSFQLYTSL